MIQTADKKILISGDTGPSANLISYGEDLDYLIHEVYSQKGFNKKLQTGKYHKAHHTSPKDVAEIANLLKPKTLVLSQYFILGVAQSKKYSMRLKL